MSGRAEVQTGYVMPLAERFTRRQLRVRQPDGSIKLEWFGSDIVQVRAELRGIITSEADRAAEAERTRRYRAEQKRRKGRARQSRSWRLDP